MVVTFALSAERLANSFLLASRRTLLRVLIATYCLLHIYLSVFVFPRKSRATKLDKDGLLGTLKQGTEILLDSVALSPPSLLNKGQVKEDSVSYPDGSLVAVKHAQLRARRVVDGPASASTVRILLTSAVQATLVKDGQGNAFFDRALDAASRLEDVDKDLNWLVCDARSAREFWGSGMWREEVINGNAAKATQGSDAAILVLNLGSAFRKWILQRGLNKALGEIVEETKQPNLAFLEAVCKNTEMDAQVVGDEESLQYSVVANALAIAWSNASESRVAALLKILAGQNVTNHHLADFATSACVAILASRRGFGGIKDKALEKAIAGLSEIDRLAIVNPSSLSGLLSILVEINLCASLARCASDASKASYILAPHLLRLISILPPQIHSEIPALLPFIESLML